MNAYKIFVVFALFVSLHGNAQPADEAAIRKVMAAQEAAWNRGDIDVFMQGYVKTDSLLFISSKGETHGYDSALARYKKTYPDKTAMGMLNFDLLQVKPLSAEYYFVVGKWHLTRSIGDAGGLYTLLFEKIDGHWLIIVDHTS